MKRRYLDATIRGFSTGTDGNCFQRSIAFVMDEPTAKVVVGTMTRSDGARFLHCWVKQGKDYLNPANWDHAKQDDRHTPEEFYASISIEDERIVDRKTVINLTTRGKVGKWMLSTDPAVYHLFDVTLGEALLREIGYPYQVKDRSILPV